MSACVPTMSESCPPARPARISRRAASRRAAHEQARRQPVLAEQCLEGRVMLAGKDLGRRHHRGLKAGVVRHQRRECRDNGLPAPDVALEQTIHRSWRREVGEDLVRGHTLTVGELERQCRDELSRDLDVVRDDRRPDRSCAAGAPVLRRPAAGTTPRTRCARAPASRSRGSPACAPGTGRRQSASTLPPRAPTAVACRAPGS